MPDPVFSKSSAIEWEYDIVPAHIQPAVEHRETPGSEGRPTDGYEEAPDPGKMICPALEAAPAVAPLSNEPTPAADFGVSHPPEPDRFLQSGASNPNYTFFGMNEHTPTDSSEKKRPNIPVIISIAVFAVVIVGFLLSGFIRSHNGSAPTGTETSATSGAWQKLTGQQKTFASRLDQKLPDALVGMSKQFTQDPLFLAAMAQAKLGDCVFNENTADVTIMLPDPHAASLNRLGVANYKARSGAQAYIRDNYARLCAMNNITTAVGYQATLFPQKAPDGSLTVDWSLPELTGVPHNYERVFTPQVSEYMKDKGFYTAALELMMPDFQNWDNHVGAQRDMMQMEEYFKSLAEALSPKGITLKQKTVVDVDTIERTLKTRLVNTWAFDSPEIEMADYRTILKVKTGQPVWFQNASDELGAQYQSGVKQVPADLGALEAAYLDNVRQKINSAYGKNGLQGVDAAYGRQYEFSWQELGEKGVAACPELVEDIRQYLFNYDFHLMFLADTAGVGER